MMQFFKKTLKYTLILFVILAIILSIGVNMPISFYSPKKEVDAVVLIKNCHIVDVKTGQIRPNQQVLVVNDTIIAIDTVSKQLNIAQNPRIIDAQGQYLMPSLWDMHIHTISLSPQLHFPLLIANGVTAVRDMGDGHSWQSDIDNLSERDKAIWERKAHDNALLMPKILEATSFHLEELEDVNENNCKEKIAALVGQLKKRKEPFIKLQLEESGLPDTVFYELQHQAQRQGLPILGHISRNVDIMKVADLGYKSIEHAWALIPHFTKEKPVIKKDIARKSYELAHQDSAITKRVLQKLAQKNVYYVPTHVTSNRKEYLAFEKEFGNNPKNIYVEGTQLFFWKCLNWLHTKGYDKEKDLPILKKYYETGLNITKQAQENGVKILAGTDALDRNVYYGFSVHEELQEMVKAGLTNTQALQTATINAAEYVNLRNQYGSIEVGKSADFILLKANPLQDIRHTEQLSAVYYNRRWYDETDLEQMKLFSKEQANSFSISCKFIWNMLKAGFE